MVTANKQVQILLADDHPLFLKGLREMIEEETDWLVIAEAMDGRQAIELISERSPDIAILDINMPHRDGLEVAKYCYENHLPTHLIILTMYDDALLLNRAASYGVKGFILKESAIDDILDGIEAVRIGKTFISPKMASRMLNGSVENTRLRNTVRFKLTKAEQQIVRMIAEGQTTKSIAEKLFISSKTVQNHRSNICKKLNISGKNALLRYVLENKAILLKALREV
jgi:DNA-binding NarL/FixJ family response regulator